MTIACLGWGSLIWNPGTLLIRNRWFEDGPLLPIEFTRRSHNGRVTLIIDEAAMPVRTLWALMTTCDLGEAMKSLQEREETAKKNIHSALANDASAQGFRRSIVDWLVKNQLDAAIWTGLSYSEHTDHKRPDIRFVLDHLRKLDHNARKVAEEYIRRAPRQIDTEYRRQIELEFGWTCFAE
jgi:hypothetical protein